MSELERLEQLPQTWLRVRLGDTDVMLDAAQLIRGLAAHLPAFIRPYADGEQPAQIDAMRLALRVLIARELPKIKRQIAAERPGYPLPDPPRHTDLVTYLFGYYARYVLADLDKNMVSLATREAPEHERDGNHAIEIIGAFVGLAGMAATVAGIGDALGAGAAPAAQPRTPDPADDADGAGNGTHEAAEHRPASGFTL